ncbi:hypothetical protein BCR34DRAFT_640347 [Clohesyomyces aquaticus]|uniref:Uncharacterized protein n=1 Tax=Clohesyomyces aquaticus TaxID=1231657 RepID=A0A1Y1YLJ6_9PLEO|nr:hypothetical protein BCR34DRAFT_640347 [Clohesyomyces aquaticus]
MAPKHSMFVIAEINGKYRGFAACYHGWSCPADAVEACMGVFNNVLQDARKRHTLLLELPRAATLPSEIWEASANWDDTTPEFPFNTTCLMTAIGLSLDTGSVTSIHLFPWNMSYNETTINDNEGATIIDISNPDFACYCFVIWNVGHDSDSDDTPSDTRQLRKQQLSLVPLTG